MHLPWFKSLNTVGLDKSFMGFIKSFMGFTKQLC